MSTVTPSLVGLGMFSDTPSTFNGAANCEGYRGGEVFFELVKEHKTEQNWLKDCRHGFFIKSELLKPIENIDNSALNVGIISHTEEFWVTLDPDSVWPVLHPKA